MKSFGEKGGGKIVNENHAIVVTTHLNCTCFHWYLFWILTCPVILLKIKSPHEFYRHFYFPLNWVITFLFALPWSILLIVWVLLVASKRLLLLTGTWQCFGSHRSNFCGQRSPSCKASKSGFLPAAHCRLWDGTVMLRFSHLGLSWEPGSGFQWFQELCGRGADVQTEWVLCQPGGWERAALHQCSQCGEKILYSHRIFFPTCLTTAFTHLFTDAVLKHWGHPRST